MSFLANFIITWVIGLLVPLLARFAIVKKPLSNKAATWLAVANSVVLWSLGTTLNSIAGERDPTHGFVWILVYYVAEMILLSKDASASQDLIEPEED